MTPTRSTLLLAAVALLAAGAPLGCNLLLGGGYVVGADDGSVGPDVTAGDASEAATPVDASHDSPDASADACPANPQNKVALESACTNASCQPFDNATNNPGCEGGTACPPLPPSEGGVPVVPDASAAIPDGGVSCFSLTQGPAGGPLPKPIIYAAGSTAIQPYMGRVAQVLESLGIGSVVYLGSGSCLGVDAMLDGTPLQEVAIANSPATPPSATYYDSQLNNGALQSGTCYIDNSTVLPDLGVSDVFPTTCDPQLISQGGLPNSLHDFFGPVQTMELVVPISSSQLSISAEAAYMVWGFGAASGVSPWTDPGFLLDRAPSSGTQNMIAQTIGVPAAQWLGSPQQSSGAIVTAITNVSKGDAIDGGPGDPSDVNKTMGILASDVADSNRQYLKPLAFQDVGQACGWYPDSTGASFDKQNVRDGHYPIWGPSHLVAAVDGSGNPTNPAVKNVIDTLNGANTAVTMTLDVIQFYASSHIVPQCAMHVQRAQDGHDYSPYTPAVSCSCYYDLQATGQTTCQKCTLDSDCADAGASDTCQKFGNPPVGYCEPPGSGQ